MAEPNNTRASTPVPEEDEKVTYYGNCHCGAFKFSLNISPLKTKDDHATTENRTIATECSCSICRKKGYLLVFPGSDGFTIEKGSIDETLESYLFNSHQTSHRFCRNCGTPVLAYRSTAPPERQFGFNVRTLYKTGINPDDLVIREFDGFNQVKGEWKPPVFDDHGLQISEEEKAQGFRIYNGSCHCGKVKVAVKSKTLEGGEADVRSDDCSICSRHALKFVYPTPHQSLVAYAGEENLQTYFFGPKFNGHRFCKDCGVQVDINVIGPPGIRERISQLPEEKRAMVLKNLDTRPVNLRVLDDWVLRGGEKGWGLDKVIKKSRGEGEDYIVV